MHSTRSILTDAFFDEGTLFAPFGIARTIGRAEMDTIVSKLQKIISDLKSESILCEIRNGSGKFTGSHGRGITLEMAELKISRGGGFYREGKSCVYHFTSYYENSYRDLLCNQSKDLLNLMIHLNHEFTSYMIELEFHLD